MVTQIGGKKTIHQNHKYAQHLSVFLCLLSFFRERK
jgi:hypothetical protein